jgi:diaminohydroxyphosphoribosylaminopyrimidine deaminase / 5-amino-6-(5-phosphoribosylamino)uracil reductase
MNTNEKYMSRCLDLAILGEGDVSPNPMVGSVIVYRDKIIGEGFHQKYGHPHAEVNAINSVKDPRLLEAGVLYVNLEPCSHYGHTPPCSDLIIRKNIPKVVIGTLDPFAEVAGRGVDKMRKAGIEVDVGILASECYELNRRFFTFHNKRRPYVILKWAQTADGFIDMKREKTRIGEPVWITGETALRLVHKIRSAEDAILVGTNTALNDNPSLTVRNWSGRNPLRAVIDRELRLPQTLNLFNGKSKTIIFNSRKNSLTETLSFVKLDFKKDIVPQILNSLFERQILSLVIEGGKILLESFIKSRQWDEAHIFIGNKMFFDGITAPKTEGKIIDNINIDNDRLIVLRNTDSDTRPANI